MADSLSNSVSPRVRFSLRWKIAIPFLLLALALGLGFLYLVNRLIREGEQERFLRQLAASGQQAVDALVRQEADLLALERLIANTEGVGEAAFLGNAEDLRDRVLPVFVNEMRDLVAVIDLRGTSVLTARRRPGASQGEFETLRGEAFYARWPSVMSAMQGTVNDPQGDKRAGVEVLTIDGRPVPVFFVAGPLRATTGQVVGVVLVGEYLDTLVEDLQQAAGASVGLYSLASGDLLATTLEPQDPGALRLSAEAIRAAYAPDKAAEALRVFDVNGQLQEEVLTAFTARRGADILGVMGISLPQITLSSAMQQDLTRVALFGAVSLALVMVAGLLISSIVTSPLAEVAAAAQQLASGDTALTLPEVGSDEIGLMARNLNTLAMHLKSRPSAPTLAARGAAGGSTDAGDEENRLAEATLLVIDLRPALLADSAEQGFVRRFLAETLDVIARHAGTVETWDDDQLVASFGMRPRQLPAKVGALQAVHAGVALREGADLRNLQRAAEGQAMQTVGMGIATGMVRTIAPGVPGLPGRVLSGPALDEARRLKAASRDLPAGGLLITQTTCDRLGSSQSQFTFGRAGRIPIPGSEAGILIREVLERTTRLVPDEDPGWGSNPGAA